MQNLLKKSNNQILTQTISELSVKDTNAVLYDWSIWAREKQRIPTEHWDTWLVNAGRGFGKTRTGAETVRIWKDHNPIIHLVAPTASDARDVMVEGESGILAISPPDDRPKYTPSIRRLTWKNGAIAILFSADEPDRLRGPQCYKAWADELAAWRYPDAWDQLQFGLRLGNHPQVVVTTTPRPTPIIKELISFDTTHLTCGSTYENQDNLSANFIRAIENRYEGTRLGRQEIYAEILDDVEGALWKSTLIDKTRVKEAPEMVRKIVAVDPAVSSNKDSDETGIIVCGLGIDGRGYLLDDYSGVFTPNQWAMRVIAAYHKHKCDRVIAEKNQGGDMIENTIRTIDPNISYKGITARDGKRTRAEPIAALYEQERVSHVGVLPQLENQMTTWDPKSSLKSPDRIDGMVHGLTELMIGTFEECFTV